jgi:hypothetical protein
LRASCIKHTQCHGTRRGVRGNEDFTQKPQGWSREDADAAGSLAAGTRAAHGFRATSGYWNRRRGRTKWLGKTTDEPVEEIGEFVT